jgi:ABC-type uncharacterized transport system substrate-binding protein
MLFFPLLVGATAPEQPLRQIAIVSTESFNTLVHRIEASVFMEGASHPMLIHLDAYQLNPDNINQSDYELIVTVGEVALDKVLEHKITKPILATLLRKSQFYGLLSNYNILLPSHRPQITALFLDQPIYRQMNLIKCLLPDMPQKNAVGVILGPGSSLYQNTLKKAAMDKRLSLNMVYVNPSENPISAMNYVLREAKVLLTIPDPSVYNVHTARGILLSAFRSHVPVIGFSKAYVNIGALAAIYSNPHHMALEISEEIMHIFNHPGRPLSPPKYPHMFQVALNTQVCQAFSLPDYSESALHYALQEMERTHGEVCHVPKL